MHYTTGTVCNHRTYDITRACTSPDLADLLIKEHLFCTFTVALALLMASSQSDSLSYLRAFVTTWRSGNYKFVTIFILHLYAHSICVSLVWLSCIPKLLVRVFRGISQSTH